MMGCINGIFASVVTSLMAFLALYYGIQQSENVKLFTIYFPDCPAHLLPSSKYFKTYHAFGYDQYSNDCKVVRIVTYHKLDTSTRTLFFTDDYNFFHVYSLNADSWTQLIDTTIHHSNIRLFSRFNGDHYTHTAALLLYKIVSQEIKILQPEAFQSHSSQQSYGLHGEPCFIQRS